jgi:hypothetical protein
MVKNKSLNKYKSKINFRKRIGFVNNKKMKNRNRASWQSTFKNMKNTFNEMKNMSKSKNGRNSIVKLLQPRKNIPHLIESSIPFNSDLIQMPSLEEQNKIKKAEIMIENLKRDVNHLNNEKKEKEKQIQSNKWGILHKVLKGGALALGLAGLGYGAHQYGAAGYLKSAYDTYFGPSKSLELIPPT